LHDYEDEPLIQSEFKTSETEKLAEYGGSLLLDYLKARLDLYKRDYEIY